MLDYKIAKTKLFNRKNILLFFCPVTFDVFEKAEKREKLQKCHSSVMDELDGGSGGGDGQAQYGDTGAKGHHKGKLLTAQSKLAKTSKMIPLISRHNKLAPNSSVGYYGIQRSEEILPDNFQLFSGIQHSNGKRTARDDMENIPPSTRFGSGEQLSVDMLSSQPTSPMSDSANTILSSSKYESSGSGTTSKTVTDSDSEM